MLGTSLFIFQATSFTLCKKAIVTRFKEWQSLFCSDCNQKTKEISLPATPHLLGQFIFLIKFLHIIATCSFEFFTSLSSVIPKLIIPQFKYFRVPWLSLLIRLSQCLKLVVIGDQLNFDCSPNLYDANKLLNEISFVLHLCFTYGKISFTALKC